MGFVFSEQACGTKGLERGWGGSWAYWATGYVESMKLSGDHTLELRGSYIASDDGSHTFEVQAKTYGVSGDGKMRSAQFLFDGNDDKQRGTPYSRTISLTKDFRYSFRLSVTDTYYYVSLWLQVQSPSRSKHDMDGDDAETCEVSGCRDMSLLPSPYLCKPSPSPSVSPSPKFSPSVRFSASSKLSPSPKFSNSLVFSLSKTHKRTSVFTASKRHLESSQFPHSSHFQDSPRFEESANFISTVDFIETGSLDDSMQFEATGEFNITESFDLTSLFAASHAIPFSELLKSTDNFSPSRVLIPTKILSLTSSFTRSSGFTASSRYKDSSPCPDSAPFRGSSSHRHSGSFVNSLTLTHSVHFPRSPVLQRSSPFRHSKGFLLSSLFTISNSLFPTTSVPYGSLKQSTLSATMGLYLGAAILGLVIIGTLVFVLLRHRKPETETAEICVGETEYEMESSVAEEFAAMTSINPFDDALTPCPFEDGEAFDLFGNQPSIFAEYWRE
jgi:hypothetical protein